MATRRSSPRKFVHLERTLVYYDGPQVLLGRGAKDRAFLFVAVPGGRFFGVPLAQDTVDAYFSERADLLYALKHSTDGYAYAFSRDDACAIDARIPLVKMEFRSVPPDWWPERGFFASSHTEITEADHGQPPQLIQVALDGRWDAMDLARFPNALVDAYSFIFAVRDDRVETELTRKRVFKRYPWRGGFSTVGFFNSLYATVPRRERLGINGISYHSPGHMNFSALPAVVNEVQQCVLRLMEDYDSVRGAYRELHQGMSMRKLLGRSRAEVNASIEDLGWVQAHARHLADALNFTRLDKISALTDGDWITTAKILMSFFRRVDGLADFYASGKATYQGVVDQSSAAPS